MFAITWVAIVLVGTSQMAENHQTKSDQFRAQRGP